MNDESAINKFILPQVRMQKPTATTNELVSALPSEYPSINILFSLYALSGSRNGETGTYKHLQVGSLQ